MHYLLTLFTGLGSLATGLFTRIFTFLTTSSVITFLATSFIQLLFKLKFILNIFAFAIVLVSVTLMFELVYLTFINESLSSFISSIPQSNLFSNALFLLDAVGMFEALNIMINVILIVSLTRFFFIFVFLR